MRHWRLSDKANWQNSGLLERGSVIWGSPLEEGFLPQRTGERGTGLAEKPVEELRRSLRATWADKGATPSYPWPYQQEHDEYYTKLGISQENNCTFRLFEWSRVLAEWVGRGGNRRDSVSNPDLGHRIWGPNLGDPVPDCPNTTPIDFKAQIRSTVLQLHST
jgi:hypothetical protein